MAVKKGGLGRGLGSLFEENSTDKQSAVEIRLSEIEPNRDQPRKDFDQKALEELADSISKHGLIQPILVRPLANGGYQIVAGERRWRASRMVELETVPVVIREMSDTESMEIALIENLQREDLNPVEEALGYRTLIEKHGLTQEEVAERVGKSRPAVTNAIRLLGLSDDILGMVRENKISAGHGRALLSIEDGEKRIKALDMAAAGASVRQIERVAKQGKTVSKPKENAVKDTFFSEVELALSTETGRKVKITSVKDKGTLQIDFYSKQDLADIAARLAGTDR